MGRDDVVAGMRFGRLVTVQVVRHSQQGQPFWECFCDCGKSAVRNVYTLTRGNSVSCGCKSAEASRSRARHGQKRFGTGGSPTWRSWSHMRHRCEYEKHVGWQDYGGRGIKVCERWQSFESFLADMGERPEGMSLDRIDPNGNYEPGNVRWATAKQQARNRRNSRLYVVDGKNLTAGDIAVRLGIDRDTVVERIRKWGLERALSTPPQARGLRGPNARRS